MLYSPGSGTRFMPRLTRQTLSSAYLDPTQTIYLYKTSPGFPETWRLASGKGKMQKSSDWTEYILAANELGTLSSSPSSFLNPEDFARELWGCYRNKWFWHRSFCG